MFFRMLKQSLFRGRRRKALAVATIALSATLITALMNIAIGVGDRMSREMKSYGANINVVPKGEALHLEIGGVDYNPLKGLVFLNEADLPRIKEIFWHNNIIGFAPFLEKSVEIARPGKKHVRLIGTNFNRPAHITGDEDFRSSVKTVFPYWQVKGAWPRDEEASGLLAGAALARELNLKAGDAITVKPPGRGGLEQVFTVTGILATGGREEDVLVAPLHVVQLLAGLEGKVKSVSVSALTVPEDRLSRRARADADSLDSMEYDRWYCTAYVGSITHQIEEAIPNATARPIWQVAAGEGAVVNKIQLLMAVVTLAAFIASGLGISSLMVTTIMERAKEIGLMKALGAADWEIYLLFLSEAALLGAAGGMLGCVAGAGLSRVIGLSIFGTIVPISPIVIPVNIVVSVLIALSGSLLPSRLITKLYPAEVLHGRR